MQLRRVGTELTAPEVGRGWDDDDGDDVDHDEYMYMYNQWEYLM